MLGKLSGEMVRLFSSLLTLAVSILLMPVSAVAAPVVMTGDDAFVLATRLVADGEFEKADQILRTLAAGDPTTVDMRAIDRLAAKIAFGQGDHDRAIDVLSALVAETPQDWRLQYDLAHVAMAAGQDRRAATILRQILTQQNDPRIVRRVRADLRDLAERRQFSFNVRASAAPSTNINTATSAESFDFAGVIPFALSDEARAQSGVGMNWSVGGQYSPILGGNWRGVVGLGGTLTDHSQRSFDRLETRARLGVRHHMRKGARAFSTTFVATYAQRGFGGEAYADAVGAQISLRTVLSERAAIQLGLSIEDVRHEARSDRDGLVSSLSVGGHYRLTPRMILGGNIAIAREAAAAATEANTQTSLGLSARFAGPWGLRLGVAPTVYFRNYDLAAFAYGAKREDLTHDVALSVGHARVQLGGFRPSLIYRYTDNRSTVDLFRYDRHAMDVSFARVF